MNILNPTILYFSPCPRCQTGAATYTPCRGHAPNEMPIPELTEERMRELALEEIRAHGAEANAQEIERRVAEKNALVRDAALEEAAAICADGATHDIGGSVPQTRLNLAARIRLLKSDPDAHQFCGIKLVPNYAQENDTMQWRPDPEAAPSKPCHHCTDWVQGGECCNCGKDAQPAPAQPSEEKPLWKQWQDSQDRSKAIAENSIRVLEEANAALRKEVDDLRAKPKWICETLGEPHEWWHVMGEQSKRIVALEKERDELRAEITKAEAAMAKVNASRLAAEKALDEIQVNACPSITEGWLFNIPRIHDVLRRTGRIVLIQAPVAPCDGQESERPASKAPAPASETPDRSLSAIPWTTKEDREYVLAGVALAEAVCVNSMGVGAAVDRAKERFADAWVARNGWARG